MRSSVSRDGHQAFRWNVGGWFGAQIGSTLWLFLLGGMLATEHASLGLAVLSCGLVPNAVGAFLWSRRRHLDPYLSLQGLVACVGLFTLTALVVLDCGNQLAAADPRFQEDPRRIYWFLLLYPALMLAFFLRQRALRCGGRLTSSSS